MDQTIRNKLRNVVTQCRKLLEEAVAQVLQGQFGIYASGKKDEVHIEDDARMIHLSEEDRVYRKDILGHFEHIKAFGSKPRDALDQLIREIAFTHLNRFCAYKMMEARGLIREAVSRELRSQGFLFYLADHPADEQRYNTGQQEVAYRHFLDWLGGTLSAEIGVLFNPNDPANRLYPPQRVLDAVLALINDQELAGIWSEDETIGWVYQYFTPKELRDQARKESQTPRNSYELAFRNQFFTPRYVVEFLTDNTLGRIWYEMRKGNTKLTDQCRYMVRRPNEILLEEGQAAPQDTETSTNDLSQEELLKQPVYIPSRPKKDPRGLKILDPACGSGHFLLYCFDLLQTIYEEAYDDPALGPTLRKDYPTLDDLQRAVPGLILSHNLHGIDIDVRATQIAALALWLRCQRAYQEMGFRQARPKITRSNIVCAEPMPGEQPMLKEFIAQLEPTLLGQLIEAVFDKMKLVGEAGSLFKIEEELRDSVASAKKQWLAGPVAVQQSLFDDDESIVHQQRFDFSGITDDQFFEQAEAKVVEALRTYAEQAHNSQRLQRRLFVEDAVQGLGFVDMYRQRFDLVLMNPPYGRPSKPSLSYVKSRYSECWIDVFGAFFLRALSCIPTHGFIGAITSRTYLALSRLQKLRERVCINDASIELLIDLGFGVLDGAMVETCCTVIKKQTARTHVIMAVNARQCRVEEKEALVLDSVSRPHYPTVYFFSVSLLGKLPGMQIAYWVPAKVINLFSTFESLEPHFAVVAPGITTLGNDRFLRSWWECPAHNAEWIPFAKGGSYSPYWYDSDLVLLWGNSGNELRTFIRTTYGGSESRFIANERFYFCCGLTYPPATVKGFNVRALPAGHLFSKKGISIFPTDSSILLNLLGFLNSSLAYYLLKALTSSRQWEKGMVASLPICEKVLYNRQIQNLTLLAFENRRRIGLVDETTHLFHSPSTCGSDCEERTLLPSKWAVEYSEVKRRLDNEVMLSYSLTPDDLDQMPTTNGGDADEENGDVSEEDDEETQEFDLLSKSGWYSAQLSYCMGCSYGRWDVRICIGDIQLSSLPNPFEVLPRCSPGMLQGPDGFPATCTPEDYPLHIDWNGILVDDPDHQDDIIRRVRDVLELIWKDRADAIEKEACEILGVKDLRDYFRKPGKGGFWDDHVSRYSKSRRKAPIYWLLQSSKKNYALWIYYHRLDKDMLFKALVNYVEPKLSLVQGHLSFVRNRLQQAKDQGQGAKDIKKLEKDIDRQEEFLSELRDFEDKLRRVANLHLNPDLNDGVVLNIAPLRKLVPWKEARTYWDELLAGKYEWSSIGKQLRERSLVHGH